MTHFLIVGTIYTHFTRYTNDYLLKKRTNTSSLRDRNHFPTYELLSRVTGRTIPEH